MSNKTILVASQHNAAKLATKILKDWQFTIHVGAKYACEGLIILDENQEV